MHIVIPCIKYVHCALVLTIKDVFEFPFNNALGFFEKLLAIIS